MNDKRAEKITLSCMANHAQKQPDDGWTLAVEYIIMARQHSCYPGEPVQKGPMELCGSRSVAQSSLRRFKLSQRTGDLVK